MNIFKKIAITLTTFSLVFAPAMASANNDGKDKGGAEVRAKATISKFFNKFGNSLPKVAEMKREVEGGLLPGVRSLVKTTAKTTTTVEIKAMLLNVEKTWKTYRVSVGAAVKVERASKHTARANFKAALKTAIANKDKGAVIGVIETFFSADAAAEAKFNEARTAARAKLIVDLKATL